MAYISSNANRWYCAQESAYGQIAAITAANRIPAVTMTAQLQRAKSQRKDKTGSRTWLGLPQGVRTQASYDMKSYMRDWPDMTILPPHDPLFQAALGMPGVLWAGGTPNTGTAASSVVFMAPHGLAPGQAVTSAGEIRFVAAVADALTVVLNAPFSTAPVAGVPLGATATYSLAESLPSVSLIRLLGSVHRGAARTNRRGGGSNDHSAQWGLPRIRVQRYGAGHRGQRVVHFGAGRSG